MMITRLKLIYVIVALGTRAHIVAEAGKSRNIFHHVPGRYSCSAALKHGIRNPETETESWKQKRNTEYGIKYQ